MKGQREQAGLSCADVAAFLECDAERLATYERGELPFRFDTVQSLLVLYGVHDDAVRYELLGLAGDCARINWCLAATSTPTLADPDAWPWHPFGHNPTPPPPIAWLYSQATSLDLYAAGAVPGLLQGDQYALAVATHTAAAQTARERRLVRERVDTYVELSEQVLMEHVGSITAVVEDAALRRPIGGLDVLAEQVARLHIFARGDGRAVDVRILPVDADVYAGGTAVTLLHFAGGFPPVALVEHMGGQMLLEGPTAAPYLAAFERVKAAAHAPSVSRDILAELAEGLAVAGRADVNGAGA